MKIAALALVVLSLALPPRAAHAFAVATPSTWATEAAIEILRKGGNATDAAVAASFTLNVSQPYSMGIGGGGFFLAHHAGNSIMLDHRELAPASAHAKMFLDESGKPINYYPERVGGPNPVGVPGTVQGLWEAHRRLGKLPWKTVMAPAIRLAQQGFPLPLPFEESLAEEWPRLSPHPTSAAHFGDGEGSWLKAGNVFRQPLLARTLERIAAKGAAEFYTGDLSKTWLTAARGLGVKITPEDLKNYKVAEKKPIEYTVFGRRALTPPPPSGSGLMVAGSLRYLEHYYKTHDVPAPRSATRYITTTETLKYFQELRNRTIADYGYTKLDPQKFYGSAEEKAAWTEINKRIATRLDKIQTKVTTLSPTGGSVRGRLATLTRPVAAVTPPRRGDGHTAHLSFADDHGMVVSLTTTIEEWYGSGMIVPGHGFLLNNELSDFTAEPADHPNAAAPGKRPRSNMSPTIMLENGVPVAVVGCAGGGFIPTVLVEFLENYYVHKMSAREAIAFPRFHYHLDEEKLAVERGTPDQTVKQLKTAGYDVEIEKIGAVIQALMRHNSKEIWEAASEPRWDGLALSLPPL